MGKVREIYDNVTGFFDRKQYVVHLNEIKDEAVKSPKDINKQLDMVSVDRLKQQLAEYGRAVEDAENVDLPLWDNLIDLYYNIDIDEHVLALRETIFNRVSQTPFYIFTNGEIDEEKTKLFKKTWFNDFIRYALEADSWGFSLIQFMGIEDGIFSGVENVNRYHIKPHKNGVVKYRGLEDPFLFYDKAPYKDWTVFIESPVYLGRYNSIAKRFILKRNVNEFWGVYNELFTTPYFTIKTDINNENHRDNLLGALRGRKHSGFIFTGLEDEINAISNGGSGWDSYDKFEDKQNQGMSKAYLGGTMITDDGSSKSQSEVHERQLELFVQAKRILLMLIINEQVIPKAVKLGANLSKGDEFKFVVEDNISIKDWVGIIQILSNIFDLDKEEIQAKIGLTLEDKKDFDSEKVAEAIKNMYNNG